MIERLICEIREYAWGDTQAIANLRGVDPTGRPQAEIWMGAHRGAPSLLASSGLGLHDAIAASPNEMLGLADERASDELPFLFKVLSAAKALSIQVHPTKPQAEAGFARENRAGTDLTHDTRTYRDNNHKPELVAALTPFQALCGFRPLTATAALLTALDLAELGPLLAVIAESEHTSIQDVVGWVLARTPSEVALVIDALRLVPGDLPSQFAWIPAVAEDFPGDPGLLVGLLLNYIELAPGEAVFLGAGNVHAYLSGLAVEIMASSDNVIRAGLTVKNIDVEELMAVASFDPIEPPIQRPSGSSYRYHSDSPEFALSRIEPGSGLSNSVNGPEIVLATGGSVVLVGTDGDEIVLQSGDAAFISASEGSYVMSGDGLAWRATIGG